MAANINYRPEIDGLRALAVLGVLIYHLNPSWLPGGYLGVDIFFVISGFLITSILHKGWQSGDFSYRDFYLRRARRILPAMLAVTALTCFASYFIFFPDEMKSAARACRQALLCCSNYYFAKGDGYFDPGAELNPFLHTWSLGVEEQFYFAFPIFGLLAFRRGWLKARWVGVFVLLGLTGASLLTHFKPSYAFFSLESRAWELALGSWLAVANARGSTLTWLQGRFAAQIGFVLMLGSLIFLGRNSATPSPAAVIPLVGAALFIAGRSGTEGLLFRIFTSAPILYVGRISYVLYLVHWPMIVLCKARFGELSHLGLLCVVLVAVALSSFIHHFLEEPLRRGRCLAGPGKFLTCSAVLVIVLFSLSQFTVSKKGLVNAEIRHFYRDALPEAFMKPYWHQDKDPFEFGAANQPVTLAIWGDSHAQALIKGLQPRLIELGLRGEAWTSGGRLPGLGDGNAKNTEFQKKALNALCRPQIRRVIIVARWSGHLKGGFYLDAENTHSVQDELLIAPDKLFQSLDAAIGQLVAAGKTVVLVDPIPEAGIDVPKFIFHSSQQERNLWLKPASELYLKRQDVAFDILRRIVQKHPETVRFHPQEILIEKEGLKIFSAGKCLYIDNNHLSLDGSLLLMKQFPLIPN